MIGFIRGKTAEITDENLVLEAGGIGYNIKITPNIASDLPGIGEDVKVYTYLSVREDAMNLYGFLTKEDLELFKLLIGVNGIGPKVAQGVLSGISASDLRFAILSGDVKAISKAPGIGAKTAQRMILDLKDKLNLQDMFDLRTGRQSPSEDSASPPNGMTGVKQEAVEALTALGYSGSEALKAVRKAAVDDTMDVEALLRAALKEMAFL
ncbi:Holliday junction branch migration protein RuvA [bacterium C-53]|nr:Holliday junction branch migration protein RuvA [Lachnospiraceae bacterium]NBI01836.1 Holliday junction branch migration protein RuvA [Lachnospiraceae bacterium]RKJ12248.1 Holliday junction branch migration protein RuvA [bacterium C-53]